VYIYIYLYNTYLYNIYIHTHMHTHIHTYDCTIIRKEKRKKKKECLPEITKQEIALTHLDVAPKSVPFLIQPACNSTCTLCTLSISKRKSRYPLCIFLLYSPAIQLDPVHVFCFHCKVITSKVKNNFLDALVDSCLPDVKYFSH